MTINNRYDFLLLFDVQDGNPNGDPDGGNMPRSDIETGQGLVTDVCLKRKVRNYIELTQGNKQNFRIYVKEKELLNRLHQEAYTALDKPIKDEKGKSKEAEGVQNWMCKNFYDIRTFGAVMSTEINCGQVKGPVQLTFSRSVDPIVSADHCITRMAATNEKDEAKERTMGRKFTVPYGLYVCKGFISPAFAEKTGFSSKDLALFFEALENMFEHDHSAARGTMSTQKLIIFEHEGALGNAPAQVLFDKLSVEKVDSNSPARRFADYEVKYNGQALSTATDITYSVKSRDEIEETRDPIWKRQALATA